MKLFITLLVILTVSTTFGQCPNCGSQTAFRTPVRNTVKYFAENAPVRNAVAQVASVPFRTVASIRAGYASAGNSVRSYGSTGGYAVGYGSTGTSVRTYGSAGGYAITNTSGVVYTDVPIQRYVSTSQSSLARHMMQDHGVDITGMSEAQIRAAHNAIHANEGMRSRIRFRLFR